MYGNPGIRLKQLLRPLPIRKKKNKEKKKKNRHILELNLLFDICFPPEKLRSLLRTDATPLQTPSRGSCPGIAREKGCFE